MAAAGLENRASQGRVRRRAPRRRGRRAQLTIPAEVWKRAEELAAAAGTTTNDVLAGFAAKGMAVTERQMETARVAAARARAYEAGHPPAGKKGELPSEEELVEAAQSLRRELAADLGEA